MQVRRGISRDANVRDIFNGDPGDGQAVFNRLGWKTGAMLDAIEPFLFNGGNQPAIANNRGRRIAVICIDAENVHRI